MTSTRIIISVLLLFILCFKARTQEADEIRLEQTFHKAQDKYDAFEAKHRRTIRAKNVDLSYLEWGANTNKEFVLVWLHGSLSNAYELAPYAEEFVKVGYRVLSIDQYNSGKTLLPEFDASFDDLSEDIKTLLDSLQISQVVLGGFSRGGFLATNFYQLYPSYVKGLILEDGGSVAFSTSYLKLNKDALQQKLKDVTPPDEIKEQYFAQYPSKFKAYRSLYDSADTTNQFEILSYIRPMGEQWITYYGQPEYYHMQDSLHMAEAIFDRPNVSKYASSIIKVNPPVIFQNLKIPVLIFDPVSTDDPIPVYEENKKLAESHPQWITHIVVEGVAHNIHYAESQIFIKAITGFLAKL
ncbi:MAG: alpha/beta hydrolase [Sphingobacterium sp.]|jgi:pimeloyl-ACP methyl ester carboxylesterase|nr:alpha/beta hydrolase [Sphingobacterium sp.]